MSSAVIPRSKDTSTLHPVITAIPYETLYEKLLSATPIPSPPNNGTLSLIVERPNINERTISTSAHLTREHGMEKSGWQCRPERGTIDQICVMSTAAIAAITGSTSHEQWAEAGDQLFLDFELGVHNLSVGDRVLIGDPESGVVLQVTSKPHTGCAKFSKRFGVSALKVVSTPLARERRLRGIYFCVIRDGHVHTNDPVVKVSADFGNPE